MSFLEVKGSLAKLLATENLHVQHDSTASTASFNTATRVLTLPILATESAHVYDMFVGHEVGHALYTPNDWRDQVDDTVPFDFVNVIEDARIEKLIQTKFPGLRVDFSHGYTELNDKDFFDIADKDFSKLNLIDRINLHFKLGARALMPFTAEERVWVDRVDNADTFEKVCRVATELAHYVDAKRKEDEQQLQSVAAPGDSEDIDPEGKPSDVPAESPEASTEAGENAPEQTPDSNDDKVSETQRAMDEAMKNMAAEPTDKVCYLTTPTEPLSPYPLDFLREDFQTQERRRYEAARENYQAFTNSIKRDVNFMVQQFEMKKSADAYARQQIHKTGVLNTDVLHNYKLTDDVFLRQTVTPDGKNHGLFMLVDWSGSMSDNIVATVKQLLVLVTFCRKVGIPFEVYTFTCQGYGYMSDGPELQPGEITTSGLVVTHVLSSSEKRRNIDKDMYHLYCQAWKLEYSFSVAPYSNQLSMGGTPLNNVLFAVPQLISQFKRTNNLQKVSFVCLTDGESSPTHFFQQRSYGYGQAMTNPYQTTLLRDGHHVYQIDTTNETPSIISYLTKKMPDVTITNIYLAGPKGAASYYTHLTRQFDPDMTQYKKQGAQTFTTNGWPLVALVNPRSFTDPAQEMECEAGASKAKVRSALRKFLKTKTTSKLLLSTLVSQFS